MSDNNKKKKKTAPSKEELDKALDTFLVAMVDSDKPQDREFLKILLPGLTKRLNDLEHKVEKLEKIIKDRVLNHVGF